MKGRKKLTTGNNENNTLNFIIQQKLLKIETSLMVEVVKVYDDYVDVKPLINLLDGYNQGIEHNIINKIPYFTYQSGTSAIKITPVIGDYGLCIVSKQDITKLKNSKKRSNPDTLRNFNLSDAVYLGSFIKKATPTNYIEIEAGKIDIKGTGDININCVNANITATEKTEINCVNSTINATEKATVNSPAIELGTGATQGIARLGDTVDLVPTSPTYAKIITASTISKSL